MPDSAADQKDRRFKTLEAIHDEAVDAIITIDPAGIIASVNPAACLMFGYSAEELLGANVKVLMPAPYRAAHDGYLKNYHDTNVKKIIGIGREVVGKRKDDSTFPIHLAVSEIKVGDEQLFAGVIRDLTEFKRLEDQETMLGRIVEDSLNEIYIFDSQTLNFVQVNRGARRNLGYDLETLIRMTPVDIKPAFSEASFREQIAPLDHGEVTRLEFDAVHRRSDGTEYDVEVFLQKSNYLNQAVFVAIILDVSQRRKMEREVQRQREAIQEELEQLVRVRTNELQEAQADLVRSEKFATLGKVSGGIAHEIRNPLNAVKTSAYYLLNAKSPAPEKLREHLERIDRQVSMIDNVITALSDVAKLPEANLLPIDLAPLLRSVVNRVSLPTDVKVVFDLPDDLPPAMADEQQILIAFKNLIRNARDAMSEGGTLTIGARVVAGDIMFDVIDDGTGIEPSILEKISEPLFTTKARGMGLGLSITRSIVEKNQGSLVVESEPGVGSRFSVCLKCEE